MTFTYRYRKQIIMALLAVVILITGGTFLFFSVKAEPVEAKKVIKVAKKEEQEEKNVDPETYKVDIKGEVMAPGIYTLTKESRIMDAITASGGLTENADTSVINLSKKITDEMVIIVYSYDEVRDFVKTKEQEEKVQEECQKGGKYELENNACIEENKKESSPLLTGKISINEATKEELMNLSGVGESKALAIIEYRETNGPFEKIEDVKKVTGIGESLFAKIQENITT